MDFVDLNKLIECLEYGTKLHISVVFMKDFGNYKMALPFERVIHSKPYCRLMKEKPNGYKRCFACRLLALIKAEREKRAFDGVCINGVFEYVHPVVIGEDTVAVILIGNILNGDIKVLRETFEQNCSSERCRDIANIIDGHIRLLDKEYSGIKNSYEPLIVNIMSYIEDSIGCDVKVSQIASAFNYSEKYIGQYFKKHTGMTIIEYINSKRLDNAEKMLVTTTASVTEISSLSGFNNVAYFNRLFKSRYGITPREYRVKYR